MTDVGHPWNLVSLGEVIRIRSGGFIKRADYADSSPERPYRVVGAGGPIGFAAAFNAAPPALVLGRVGAAGAVREYQEPVWVSDNALIVTPDDRIDQRFLAHFLRTVRWRDIQTGSSQPLITQALIKNLTVPLPPIEEQRRIAAKLDDLLGRMAATRERLDRVPAILSRFRQSVLAAAVSGRLTEDWREKHRDAESADLLLDRARDAGLPLASAAVRRRRSGGIALEDWPFELPPTWQLCTVRQLLDLGVVVDFQDGNHGSLYPRASDFGDSGIRFLTATQVYDGEIHISEAPWLSHAKASQLRIGSTRPRDVLLTHNATVGRVALMPIGAETCILGTSVTYYRFHPDFLDPEFCALAMQAPHWQRQLTAIMEQTTRNQVSVTKQIELTLPVPPISEQREIARRCSQILGLATTAQNRHEAASLKSCRVPDTILTRAFSGGL